MNSLVKKVIDHFRNPTGDELLTLPEPIKKDIYLKLKNGEEKLILSIKTHRTIHKASTFSDSNTFYSAYAIITSERLIFAKNSSRFKTFDEIPMSLIDNYTYEKNGNEPLLKIKSASSKFILELPSRSSEQAKTFTNALQTVLNQHKTMECRKCSKKIPTDSVYCSHCGEKTEKE